MKTPRIRYGLLREVIVMAFDTVRTNKLRSGLTVLGVVIGITSIVAMTALIRGFDTSLQESLSTAMGPRAIFVQRFGILSFASGREFSEVIKRPTLTMGDARALEEQATTLEIVDIQIGRGPGQTISRRVSYRDQKTRPMFVFGSGERYAEGTRIPMTAGRFFSGIEVQHRSNVAVIGHGVYQLLFQERGIDPVGKTVRIGSDQFTVVGVFGSVPSPGNFTVNQDDFVVMPHTTFQRVYGVSIVQSFRGRLGMPVMISVAPREGVSQAAAVDEIERIMRTRHGLRLDEPNDFDIVTHDALMRVWDQISRATFFALVVISSIALMVGGIGVMAIMSISVTERTREIGVRRALGARKREVLFQFLTEAVFLTSVGGLLGIVLGSAIGLAVHFFTGFPVSLPMWSFALGLGFSATVGIAFGMYPAIRAARLDPIEALRYE
ncbi:MAG TPA: ABC transporter permease [Vicinamibacterales bacterium]|nr:ABC transporter permease [Vicinamibacterales bacterium]